MALIITATWILGHFTQETFKAKIKTSQVYLYSAFTTVCSECMRYAFYRLEIITSYIHPDKFASFFDLNDVLH